MQTTELDGAGIVSNITDLKDAIHSKTVISALLTVATMGIYPILWLDRNSGIISGVTKHKIVDRSVEQAVPAAANDGFGEGFRNF